MTKAYEEELVSIAAEDGLPLDGAVIRPVGRSTHPVPLVYVHGLSEPIVLPRESQGLQLLQRLRDEAHRFANAYHQKLRERRIVFSALDEIPGVGERRKKALIRQFGSVRSIRAAGVEDIAAVEGVGPKVAERIHQYLKDHPA